VGNVRLILWQHLEQVHQGSNRPYGDDPNDLAPAAEFAAAVGVLSSEQQAELGRSYAQLWGRTFRTLARHLRGQPERALAVFIEEALPYLLASRVAGRLDRIEGHVAHAVIPTELPSFYVAGMMRGFVELAGASAEIEVAHDDFTVRFKLKPAERAARLVRHLAQLRIPLLLASVLAACVGIVAGTLNAPATAWQILAVLLGTIAAQSGANALHDLLATRPTNLLSSPSLGRRWLKFQFIGSYALAAGCLAWLLPGRWALLGFAAAGFLLGRSYLAYKDAGLGPLIAGITHGPLIIWGATYALGGAGFIVTPLPALLLALPTGALAAALVLVDDLADKPLDQAAGSRTLVLRLSQGRQMRALALLLTLALAPIIIAAVVFADLIWIGAAGLLASLSVAVFLGVKVNADDPAALANPRSQLLGLYTLTSAAFCILLLRSL
jgi:1,4-dihydroxy-2-naphthoate octaprenyltransferase